MSDHHLRTFYTSHVDTRSGLAPAQTKQLTGHTSQRVHDKYVRPIPSTEPMIVAGLDRAFAEELA